MSCPAEGATTVVSQDHPPSFDRKRKPGGTVSGDRVSNRVVASLWNVFASGHPMSANPARMAAVEG